MLIVAAAKICGLLERWPLLRAATVALVSLPYILKAYSTLTFFGAFSLKTDIMSKKSSNDMFPSPDDEKTSQILSLNGLTCKSQKDKYEI